MVVSLRESDDSDSDVDNCSSSQLAFGGLEFMIKEARRTAEVGPAHCRCCRQTTAARMCRFYSVTDQKNVLESSFLSKERKDDLK